MTYDKHFSMQSLNVHGLTRFKRQVLDNKNDDDRKVDVPGNKEDANCDFGLDNNAGFCKWSNLNVSAFKWLASTGTEKLWVGGPGQDMSDSTNIGGYGFFETSQLPNKPDANNTVSAMIGSPFLKSTGSIGHCFNFGYAMDGLSADKLRVLLLPFTKRGSEYKPDFKGILVLSTLKDTTMGNWKSAQILYTYPGPHKVRVLIAFALAYRFNKRFADCLGGNT